VGSQDLNKLWKSDARLMMNEARKERKGRKVGRKKGFKSLM
jgi:hypothetical protein